MSRLPNNVRQDLIEFLRNEMEGLNPNACSATVAIGENTYHWLQRMLEWVEAQPEDKP